MEYRYIGKTGLRVTPLCLGTMTFGTMADKKTSFKIMDKAYDRGINFFDTAELYPVPPRSNYAGLTEEIVGQWLKDKPRDSLIIASKVAGAASGWFAPPIRYGLTSLDRFNIKSAIEKSLKRLKTDYIDLYQTHWPDTILPIDETLEVLSELIKEGKIRYIGTSNDSAYGLCKANECAKYKNYKRYESIQNNFSLLNPRFLDELAYVCKKEDISLLAYSPIAGGVLSGKYNNKFTSGRFAKYINDKNPRVQAQASRFVNKKTLAATKKYLSLCKKFDLNPVTFATSWSKQHDFVASSIIGATSPKQLNDTLNALDLKLDDEILQEVKKIQADIMYPMG